MARLRFNLLATASAPLSLGAPLTSSGTSVTFNAPLTHSSGTPVPSIGSGDYIALTIGTEIVYLSPYTSGATTGTIARAQENTTAAAHASGDKIIHGPTALDLTKGRIPLVYSGGAYPARLGGELYEYVGPTQPTDWAANDTWIKTP